MRPLFAITTGIALYCVCGIYWTLTDYTRFGPKALFGSVVGALAFGFYSVTEFRRMMRGEDSKYEEEKKWIESSIQAGSQLAAAQGILRDRFAMKQEAPGFSPLRGRTMVYDFSSALSNLRLVTKDGIVVSIKVDVSREN